MEKKPQEKKQWQEDIQSLKLFLVAKATDIGLWDMPINSDDPANPYNIFNFSDNFRKLLGYENEEDFPNIFKSQVDCIHPNDREFVLNSYAVHVLDTSGKTPYDLEYRMIKKNGEIGFFRDVGETMRDENGKPLFVAGALLDKTEEWKKKQEQDLQMLRIKLMTEAAGLGPWELDVVYKDGVANWEVIWSEKFKKLLGYESECEFPNTVQTVLDAIHPEDHDMVLNSLNEHLNDITGETPYNIEYRLRKKNGDYIYVHDYAQTVRDEFGNAKHSSGAMQDITEIKNTILENKTNLNKLNLIINATNLGLWEMKVVDAPFSQNNIFTFNNSFRKLLGYENEVDFPNTYDALATRLYPDDAEKVFAAFNNHLLDKSGNTPYSIEYRIMKKNGEVAYYHATANTLRDGEGNPLFTIGALLDVNKMRQTIIEANINIDRLNSVVEATKMGLWEMEVVDAPFSQNNRFVWNDILRKMLGYENEIDFPNTFHALADRLHPQDAPRVFKDFEDHLLDRTGNTPYEIEYRVFNKSGDIMHLKSIADTARDENGKPLFTVGMLMDITDVKNTISESQMQLAKMHLSLQAASIGLWEMKIIDEDVYSPNNKFIFSDEFRSLLGYESTHDFPNSLKSYRDLIHPDDIHLFDEAIKNHLSYKGYQYPYYIEEIRIKKRDGGWGYFRDSGLSLKDTDEQISYSIGALVEITKFKQLIIEVENSRKEAEIANVAKSNFLSTMSHEIRTPMNAILGITEIQLQQHLDDERRDIFEKIYSSGDLLLSIINDILDLSRIEAGKLELRNEKYEVASLLSDTVQLNMMRIGSKQIEFELHVNENVPSHLVGDGLRIKQILNNILSNAFKYTNEGIVKLLLKSLPGKNESEEMLVFDVIDTGQGMDKDQVSKIFDKYARFNTEANRNIEGTGLGMNITLNLIKLMNGTINVVSSPKKGSTFTVSLPQTIYGNARLGKSLSENLGKFRTKSMSRMKRTQINRVSMPYGKVLIVDDIETNIYVARGLMLPYDLNIDTVNSGFSAIEKIKAGNDYDIIFMDHMMPQMDGMEATRRIREMGYNAPIVALTANAIFSQKDIFLNNGFTDFISKPIDIRALDTILKKLIRDKHPNEKVADTTEKENGRESCIYAVDNDNLLKINKIFLLDANKSLNVLEKLFQNGTDLNSDELRTYTIHIHGLKSALANIGKMDISAVAMKLEEFGRCEDIEAINAETPAFFDSLREFMKEITQQDEESIDEASEEKNLLYKKLKIIYEACEEYDDIIIEEAINELKSKMWSKSTNLLLAFITEQTLLSGFEEIRDSIKVFFEERGIVI